MESNPWRITDDQIKPAAYGDIGEMRGEREGESRTISQSSVSLPNASDLRANTTEPSTGISIRPMPPAKEILGSRGDEQFLSHSCEAGALPLQDIDGRGALRAVHGTREGSFAWP